MIDANFPLLENFDGLASDPDANDDEAHLDEWWKKVAKAKVPLIVEKP